MGGMANGFQSTTVAGLSSLQQEGVGAHFCDGYTNIYLLFFLSNRSLIYLEWQKPVAELKDFSSQPSLQLGVVL